jgi:hypothetical protein
MKASELRIGNYVQANSSFIKGEPMMVTELISDDGETKIQAWCISPKCRAYGNSNNAIDPIPLTHDWMMRFEWAGLDGVRYVFKDNEYYSISEDGSLFFERTYTATDVMYVHQLQNLYFALTGSELEIK